MNSARSPASTRAAGCKVGAGVGVGTGVEVGVGGSGVADGSVVAVGVAWLRNGRLQAMETSKMVSPKRRNRVERGCIIKLPTE
jgi:hypothetical protein